MDDHVACVDEDPVRGGQALWYDEHNVAFTLFLKEDGNLRVEWFSRSVNGNNPAFRGNVVPKRLQSEIRRELKKLFPGKEIEG